MNKHTSFVAGIALLVLAALGSGNFAHGSRYTDAVLADNPLGLYRMSETSGATAFDSAGTTENGAYLSSPTLGIVGPRPQSFTGFDAANTGAQFNNASSELEVTTLSINDTAYSYELWFNYQNTTFSHQWLGGRGTGGLTWDTVGLASTTLEFWNGVSASPITGSTVSENAWHQMVYTRNGTAVNVYLDGVLNISTTQNINYGTSDRIVAGLRPGSLGQASTQMLDELAIYDYTLTAAQVTTHFQAAVPEPGSLALLGLGAAGFSSLRMRRRELIAA